LDHTFKGCGIAFSFFSTGHIYVTIQTEVQSVLAIKCHVLLAGDKCGRRACRRANRAADEGALASRSKCADQSATAADPSPVARGTEPTTTLDT
jgi:hypothetical protein